MLTPVELKNRQFKPGRGYSREEMDEFLDELFESYETIYNENAELKKQVKKLSDGVQYYKSMETTLQKALILAEKTSTETIEAAKVKADAIEKEAYVKADGIIQDASNRNKEIIDKSASLNDNYNAFKEQYRQIALKQLELLDSDFYKIDAKVEASVPAEEKAPEVEPEVKEAPPVQTETPKDTIDIPVVEVPDDDSSDPLDDLFKDLR